MNRSSNPLIVQSDHTVLVEVASHRYDEVRDVLARFAELEKSPEHVHTYRITSLSLWNAASSGMQADEVVAALDEFGKFDLPGNVRREIFDRMSRYGRVRLLASDGRLVLESDDELLITEISGNRLLRRLVVSRPGPCRLEIEADKRGSVKQALLKIGYPAEDLAGYVAGESLAVILRDTTLSTGGPFELRRYQHEAVSVFHADGSARGGSGVIVLPCGAGKTIVGMGVMAAVGANTLILTPSIVAARQWMSELVDKTTLTPEMIGEYSGHTKEIRPVTVSTYQTLTYRPSKTGEFKHLGLFDEHNWGLIVYDEVHLLPAPVFRATADIQARRRLGLTATLVREDGRADDVFSLIGPKKYDVPWRDLERQGWIATAECTEIRVPLPEAERFEYAVAPEREKYSVAARNSDKLKVISSILAMHTDDSVLVIGQYIEQLERIAERFAIPLITGKTPVKERQTLYAQLRSGELKRLVVSKVGNFSVDLPDVNVAIQVSGTFGSRQEEAQRLGRILRPKSDGGPASFYSVVTRDSRDQEFAAKRQLFLAEQGYRYRILYDDELMASGDGDE